MKDEELWNKILLVVEIGDIVRFKYGHTNWTVMTINRLSSPKKYWIRLSRRKRRRLGWGYETIYKEVWQGTEEYRNIRIVKPHE